jgi:hypothetical protein
MEERELARVGFENSDEMHPSGGLSDADHT